MNQCSNINLITHSSPLPSSLTSPALSVFNPDSGASRHFVALADLGCLTNVAASVPPVTVHLPDGSTAISTYVGHLNIPGISLKATQAHVVPTFTKSLLSIGQLCDDGMIATYDAEAVTITTPQGITVLSGPRDLTNGLWKVNLLATANLVSNGPTILNKPAHWIPTHNMSQLVSFYHAAMFSPVISTLAAAMHKGFLTLPGISSADLLKYDPYAQATAKGHMDQNRQGTRSTKISMIYSESDSDWHPSPTTAPVLSSDIFTKSLTICQLFILT